MLLLCTNTVYTESETAEYWNKLACFCSSDCFGKKTFWFRRASVIEKVFEYKASLSAKKVGKGSPLPLRITSLLRWERWAQL